MHPWTLENAKAFVADLQSRVRGYDLEIVGGVIRKGYSDKDVDIVLTKNAEFSHADEAADAMQAMGAAFKGRIDKIPMEGWFLADGRRVDFFYAEKGDKRKRRPVVETTMRDLIMLAESASLPEFVYHGTIMRLWTAAHTGSTNLFLARDRDEAESYADRSYENGCQTELNDEGHFPYDPESTPIIVEFRLADLMADSTLAFDYDWGWEDAADGTTWQQSLAEVGSFVVTGFTDGHRKLGKVALAYPEYHAEQMALLSQP
jgi:hypothetical protein